MRYFVVILVICAVAVVLHRVLVLEQASYWVAAVGIVVTIGVAWMEKRKTGVTIAAGGSVRKTGVRSDGDVTLTAGQDIDETTVDNKRG